VLGGVLSDGQCGSPKDRLEDGQIRDESMYHFYELPNHFAELLAITSPWGRGIVAEIVLIIGRQV
jgi:hypothetical protein